MMPQTSRIDAAPSGGASDIAVLSEADRERIQAEVALAAEPIAFNWPIRTFISRSPLAGFEELPFDQAVAKAKALLGGEGFLSLDQYRALFAEGRITDEDLAEAYRSLYVSDSSEASVRMGTQSLTIEHARLLTMVHGIAPADPALFSWHETQKRLPGRLRRPTSGISASRAAHHPLSSAAGTLDDPTRDASLWASCLQIFNVVASHGSEHDQDGAAAPVPRQAPGVPPSHVVTPSAAPMSTVVELIDRATGSRLLQALNDELIKWCAAFLDEGFSAWTMPSRERGFFAAWRTLAQRDWSGHFLGIEHFKAKVRRVSEHPEDVIASCLNKLDVPESERIEYLSRHLAQLPGWAGFIRWRGHHPEYHAETHHPIGIDEYLAVRLFYEVELADSAGRSMLHVPATRPQLRMLTEPSAVERPVAPAEPHAADPRTDVIGRDGWRLFLLARAMGLDPEELSTLHREDARIVLGWLDSYPPEKQQMVWQEAYERHYRRTLLGKLRRPHHGVSVGLRPSAHAVFCIDVRSEPLRRHLEAQGNYETIGFAGFFGTPICYSPFDREDDLQLCPVLIKPKYTVKEGPRPDEHAASERHLAGSRWHEIFDRVVHDMKANPLGSYVLIDLAGAFFAFALLGKTVLLKAYDGIMARLHRWVAPPVTTHIPIERLSGTECDAFVSLQERAVVAAVLTGRHPTLAASGADWTALVEDIRSAAIEPAGRSLQDVVSTETAEAAFRRLGLSRDEGQALLADLRNRHHLDQAQHKARVAQLSQYGLTLNEQGFVVESALRVMGLIDHFARLVLLCGHGSTTENNPYAAAYDCGACGGHHGGPTARVLARMANKPEVRSLLRARGLDIPSDTYFLAGEHDTTREHVTFLDLVDLPSTHRADCRRLAEEMTRAGAQAAVERCRRLPCAPRLSSSEAGVRHVRHRSRDWAQVQPEWGLSGNAAFIIGRRALTREVDLEGRVFLHSYDASRDPQGKVLETILTAPLVVAEWINLQYYFSAVDPWKYGSGTKVLHNVVGGVGVMLGRTSDLQAGLPLQSVSGGGRLFHEPMRLLAVIESETERLSEMIARHAVLQRLFNHGWVRLVAVDPRTGTQSEYRPHAHWTPLEVDRSAVRPTP